ncbi:MAG: hypothetical protein U0Q11_21060 [Vicinamibacterales bacterium]
MANWQGVIGVNRAYVLELYERYKVDPQAVDAETRALFARGRRPKTPTRPRPRSPGMRSRKPSPPSNSHTRFAATAIWPRRSIRSGTAAGDPSLDAATHGLTDDDLRALPPTLLSSPLATGAANMLEVVNRFRAVYCSTSARLRARLRSRGACAWPRTAVEQGRFRSPSDPVNPVALLDRLAGRSLQPFPALCFRRRRASPSKVWT